MLATVPEGHAATHDPRLGAQLREKSLAKSEGAAAEVVDLMARLCEDGLGQDEHRQITQKIVGMRTAMCEERDFRAELVAASFAQPDVPPRTPIRTARGTPRKSPNRGSSGTPRKSPSKVSTEQRQALFEMRTLQRVKESLLSELNDIRSAPVRQCHSR